MNTYKKKAFLILILTTMSLLFATTFFLDKRSKKEVRDLNHRTDLAVSVLSDFGYGGIIHGFKNFLIRGRQADYNNILIKFNHIQKSIVTYTQKDLSDLEKRSLKDVLQTAQDYRSSLEIIRERRSQSKFKIRDIDKIVKIDDEKALKGISFLIQELNKRTRLAEKRANQASLSFFAIVLIFGIFLGFLYFKEISSLGKRNQQLATANEELVQFSYRTSHDLKSPLTTIIGLTEATVEDLQDGDLEEAKQNLERINRQSKRLETLVQDILKLARLDLAEDSQDIVELQSIVKEVEEGHAHSLQLNGVRFQSEVSLTRQHRTSRIRLYQIISNIAGNGIKYHDPKKKDCFVSIKITDNANDLLIEIEDNGIGIPAKDKSDVYKMFKQFHSDNSLGSGLGMHIVKKSVDALDGKIDFKSSSQGTIFSLVIPTDNQ